MLVDLHTHTRASDGTMTGTELIEYALKSGITHIAVTDHDTGASFSEMMGAAERYNITVIAGIEFGSEFGGSSEVHILGYGMDLENRSLNDAIKALADGRVERMKKMIAKLNKLGIDISFEELEKDVSIITGRLHLARMLADKGIVENESEAFEKYIGSDRPAYVPRFCLKCHELAKLINSAGGITCIAHPYISDLSEDDIRGIISDGIQGIEVYYPGHTPIFRESLLRIAREYSLAVTGGTDFHGRRLGVLHPLGMTEYPAAYFYNFLDRIGIPHRNEAVNER